MRDALIGSVTTGIPIDFAATLWGDPIARWTLVGGLSIGYVLSSMSDRRMYRCFSGFWHLHRPELRTAVRSFSRRSTC